MLLVAEALTLAVNVKVFGLLGAPGSETIQRSLELTHHLTEGGVYYWKAG